MSMFNPDTFLDATIEAPTEKRPPLPAGDYTAVIGEVKSRAWQGKKDPTRSGIAWDIPLTLEIPADVQTQLGLTQPTITLTDSIMLDLTDAGTIDNSPGKNRGLRNYREALDMNKAGDVFSARKMTGQAIRVKVKHELYEDQIMERVGGVVRA